MKRHYKAGNDSVYLHRIRPADAGWKYLSFLVASLRAGQTLPLASGEDELLIVPLSGRGRVRFSDQAHLLDRPDLFHSRPDLVYLPPGLDYCLEAESNFEVAIGGAPARGRFPPRFLSHENIATNVRGDANVRRGVSILADSDDFTERLTAYEIHTPSGNWSSFPPHRHDTRGGSSYHEETYYFRFKPETGFALQRIYTRDTELDVAIPVQHGDLVLIHEGYHPVVKAPGTNAYYLNFLAGDQRKIQAVNDSAYDWVKDNWYGNPIDIPIVS